jgi:hypothetical protein
LTETWRSLNAKIGRMAEEEISEALALERATHKRASMLERLHRRYCSLRASRERIEIMREAVRG